METLNQTVQKLNTTLLDSITKANATQLQLNTVEKSVNTKPPAAPAGADCAKEIADLGSSLGSRVSDLEHKIELVKAQVTNTKPSNNDVAPPKPSQQQTASVPNA